MFAKGSVNSEELTNEGSSSSYSHSTQSRAGHFVIKLLENATERILFLGVLKIMTRRFLKENASGT